jgi:succinate dehydrogenase hydrophobic anchor subunit
MEAVKPRTLALQKRGLNFETAMWFLARLSVLAIYGFILAGILGGLVASAQTQTNLAEVLRWAFFPNQTGNPLSAMPWVSVLAKLMVIGFIAVVSWHGVHGMLVIVDDFISDLKAQRWYHKAMIGYALLVNVIAIYIIWTA